MSQEQKLSLARGYTYALDPTVMSKCKFNDVKLTPCDCNEDPKQSDDYVCECLAQEPTVCENADGKHLVGTVVRGGGVRLMVKVREGDERRDLNANTYWNVAPDIWLERVYDEETESVIQLWNGSREQRPIATFVAIVEWLEKRPEEKFLEFGGAEYFFQDDSVPRKARGCSNISHIAAVISKFQFGGGILRPNDFKGR